jgi:hypothetical protein
MKDALKQFSEKLAEDLRTTFASQEIKDFVAATKASGDDRSFEVVMSTADEDRQGDSLDQSRWDLKYYTMNPVVLWAHNYSSFPIGAIDDIRIEGDKAIATGKFAPAGVNPDADLACALYQQKILRAVSPGYIQNDDGTRELLEVSFCPVPAGRYALSLRQVSTLGISTQELVTKGFFYREGTPPQATEKSPQIGDSCEMADGTPGELAEDDKKPGALICVPSKSNKSENMNEELNKKFKAEHERHGKAFAKAIDDYGAKAEEEKSIDEFEKAIDAEQEEHLEKCTKAIDENYELQDQKKSIDEFKSAIEAEHLTHVKATDKEIEEFKGGKSIDEFAKSIGDELDRHEKAHESLYKDEFGNGEEDGEKKFYSWREKGAVADELVEDQELQAKYQRLDKAFDIFSAFASAYLDDNTPVADFEKLLDEAVSLMKNLEAKAQGLLAAKLKAGRAISAKNRDAIEKVIKALDDHHTEHGKDVFPLSKNALQTLRKRCRPLRQATKLMLMRWRKRNSILRIVCRRRTMIT